jgi:hypothetical protein
MSFGSPHFRCRPALTILGGILSGYGIGFPKAVLQKVAESNYVDLDGYHSYQAA